MFELPSHLRLDPARAALLIRLVSNDPDGPHARAFDEYFYPAMLWFSLYRARGMVKSIRRPVGRPGTTIYVPSPEEGDLDAIAHDTATHALERARHNAGQFDPSLGDAIDWVLRNAAF